MKKVSIITKFDNNKFKKIIGFLSLLFSMVLLAFLNSKITVYSDDYWYGTFFDNGIEGFKNEMIDHYLNTNGRFYIHILIPLILLFDTHLFVLLSPLLMALLYLVSAKVLNYSISSTKLMLSGAIGILLTMSLDVQYLRMSLLWISAFFNYIFPVVMIVLALFFQIRFYNGHTTAFSTTVGLVFALLAGASTEQSGIVAMVIIFGYGILNFCRSQKKSLKYFIHFVVTLIGFMTILLAPGSWQRVDRGVEGGFFSFLVPKVFAQRFFDAMIYVIKYPSSVVLLSTIGVLVFATLFFNKKLSRLSRLIILFPIIQVASFIFGFDTLACITAAVSILAYSVLLLCMSEYQVTGLFLLGALASNLMLIITTLNSERTAMIGLILIIAVAVSLLFRLLNNFHKKISITILLALAVLTICLYCPLIKGYSAARKVVDENLVAIENSQNSDVCELNIDIDPRYRFTMFFEGRYFYDEFRKYYGVPESVKFIYKSSEWKVSEIGSENDSYIFPALEKDGVLYFPFVYTVTASGGNYTFSWKDHSYFVNLKGKVVYIFEDGTVRNALDGEMGEILYTDLKLILPFSNTYTLIYAPADKLQEFFDIKWDYNSVQSKYTIIK